MEEEVLTRGWQFNSGGRNGEGDKWKDGEGDDDLREMMGEGDKEWNGEGEKEQNKEGEGKGKVINERMKKGMTK